MLLIINDLPSIELALELASVGFGAVLILKDLWLLESPA
jgi:hypothetical protein